MYIIRGFSSSSCGGGMCGRVGSGMWCIARCRGRHRGWQMTVSIRL